MGAQAALTFCSTLLLRNRLEVVPRSMPVIRWCLLTVPPGGASFT